MPWHVAESAQCPAGKPWAVILDATGKAVGCHPTKTAALAQLAALYANEPGAKMSTDDDCGCTDLAPHFRAGTDTGAWDGPGAMSKCSKSATPASCFSAICAGKKAGDTSTQAAWALPHHSAPGSPPNAAGVSNALSRLPQTQGLTNAAAAKAHLQAHAKAINPDYQKGQPMPVTRVDGDTFLAWNQAASAVAMARAQALAGDSRQIPNDGGWREPLFAGTITRAKTVKRGGKDYFEVEGYASIVDTPYTMYDAFGPYEETIRGGAFDGSLGNPDLDVAFLVNHRGQTMARVKNGSLSVWADSTGLGVRAYLNAERQDVRDLVSGISDGLMDEMSFAFRLNAGGWNDAYDKFTIFEADINRGDVSAVNYGANPFTSIGARAPLILDELDGLPAGAARAAIVRLSGRPDIGDIPLVAGDDAVAAVTGRAKPKPLHDSHDGEHTHLHPANGVQGGDAQHTHAHTHASDASHDHQHGLAASELDDTAVSEPVQAGMSTEFLAELMQLDDDHEADMAG